MEQVHVQWLGNTLIIYMGNVEKRAGSCSHIIFQLLQYKCFSILIILYTPDKLASVSVEGKPKIIFAWYRIAETWLSTILELTVLWFVLFDAVKPH